MSDRLGQLLFGLALLAALWFATDWLDRGDMSDDRGGDAPATAPEGARLPEAAALPDGLPTAPRNATVAVVDHVHDGDTLTLEHPALGRIRTRLLRIDSPEVARNGQPAECGADEARRSLETLAPPGARVLVAADVEAQDQYDRQLLHLWKTDGTWINGQLVADGWAHVVTFRPNVAFTTELTGLEQAARAAGRGTWGRC